MTGHGVLVSRKRIRNHYEVHMIHSPNKEVDHTTIHGMDSSREKLPRKHLEREGNVGVRTTVVEPRSRDPEPKT